MTNLPSVGLVITALGGNTSVAELTHSNPKAVSNWKVSGKFPAATYVPLQARLKNVGLSAPDKLWGMRTAPKRKRKSKRKSRR